MLGLRHWLEKNTSSEFFFSPFKDLKNYFSLEIDTQPLFYIQHILIDNGVREEEKDEPFWCG